MRAYWEQFQWNSSVSQTRRISRLQSKLNEKAHSASTPAASPHPYIQIYIYMWAKKNLLRVDSAKQWSKFLGMQSKKEKISECPSVDSFIYPASPSTFAAMHLQLYQQLLYEEWNSVSLLVLFVVHHSCQWEPHFGYVHVSQRASLFPANTP